MDEAAHSRTCSGARQNCRGCRLIPSRPVAYPTMRPIREMNHDLYAVEMWRPIGFRINIADCSESRARNRFRETSGQAQNGVAALHQVTTQCAPDEAGCPGHQDERQARFLPTIGADCVSETIVNALRWVGAHLALPVTR